jgi:hypothetical protein
MHEVLHREQRALGLLGAEPANNHLDMREGRTLLRLELRAYAAALDAIDAGSDADVRRHTESGLLFRARRRALYPLADSLEPLLEMQEGLPEYTGVRLAMTLTGEGHARAARHTRAFETTPTYVRSFAYGTGAPIGLLLDRFAPEWKRTVATTRDPGRMLASAMGLRIPRDLARDTERRAREYGGTELAAQEATRDSSRRPMMDDYRRRLETGPTLAFHQPSLGRSFDPNALIAFDMTTTVYPTGTFTAEWGELVVTTGGARVANDFTSLTVEAPREAPAPDARSVSGPGWKLTLNAGWRVVPVAGRAGSLQVARQ